MVKKAVLVGCNYPGTKAELHGCVNDVVRMYQSLVQRFGFEEQDITVLIDTDERYLQPTGANIRKALNEMIANSEEGDVLFFHYSGHGTRVPAETGDQDDTGYDECIVPCDMNLINDDDFRELINKLPSGVSLTIVSDSCHSGGLIEATKEQIGDSFNPQREPEVDPLQFGDVNRGDEEYEENEEGGWSGMLKKGLKKAWESDSVRDALGIRHHKEQNYGDESAGTKQVYVGEDGIQVKNKSLPLDTFIEMLGDRTGRRDIEVGSIRPTLYDTFREDSSSKVKKFVQVLTSRLQERSVGDEEESGFMGMINSLAGQFLQAKLDETDNSDAYVQPAMETDLYAPEAAYAGRKSGNRATDMGVLVSGCQSDQTSADANPGRDPAGAYGALSNAIQTILASTEPGQPISNRYLVTEARRLLASQGFTQQPGLYCTDYNAEAPFIC
ncbi:hypothetical protein KP509_03G018900 [Ceratopteris richardii]|uniref:Peptidase C14 caspase domain-containing protein n=1 Tax=Ceratopteris richardii TaxID=49495 RepID=A0A8T2V567_CERRI|nr:hypothetical protein KP509_03G018900 [Ceratopteris richardii]